MNTAHSSGVEPHDFNSESKGYATHTKHLENATNSGHVSEQNEGFDDSFRPADTDGDFKMTWTTWLALAGLSAGWIADVFVLSMVSSVLGVINADIGPNTSYTWIASVQNVATACLAPLAGRFGDIFGRRNFLLIGSVSGVIGNIICATGNNINTLIGGATLIGVGRAFHQIGWTCVAELVPKRSRGVALGWFETSFTPASIFAGLVAYGFVSNGSWRPVFWLPMAINMVSVVLIFFFYHPKNQYIREEGRTVWNQIADTDFVGVFLSIAGLVLFLLGISFGGTRYPWKSAGTIAPIIIGIVLLIALGFWEAKAKLKYPLYPPVLFKDVRGFSVVVVGVFIAGMIYYSTLVIYPLQVRVLYTQNPIEVGAYTTVLGACGAFAAPLFGYILKKWGHAHLVLPITVAVFTFFSGLQAVVSPSSAGVSTFIVAICMGLVAALTIITTVIVQVVCKHEYIGVATGIAVCIRNLGGSLGTTIYSTILQQTLQKNLVGNVAAPLARSGVPPASLPGILRALLAPRTGTPNPLLASLTPAQLQLAGAGVITSYVGAFKTVYLVSIAFGVVSIVVVSFTANVDAKFTKTIDIKLEEGAHIKTHNDEGAGHVLHFANEQAAYEHARGNDGTGKGRDIEDSGELK